MKLLYTIHKGINYEFRLLEQSKVIQITKDCDRQFEEMTYEMKWRGNKFVCGCPGSMFHGKCWHGKMVNLLCQQLSITEPWAALAESTRGEKRLW